MPLALHGKFKQRVLEPSLDRSVSYAYSQEKKRKNNARNMYRLECEPVNPILILLPMMQYGALCLLHILNMILQWVHGSLAAGPPHSCEPPRMWLEAGLFLTNLHANTSDPLFFRI